jgi:uncharacterized ion transporter superfamily protein YfcC
MLVNSIVLVLVVIIVAALSYIIGALVAGTYWQEKIMKARIDLIAMKIKEEEKEKNESKSNE